MNKTNDFALVPAPSRAVEKTAPGANRILSGIVEDALVLTRRARQPRIVLVDDEEYLREMMELAIYACFKEAVVLSFGDGDRAWQELMRTPPDLLITDMVRDGLNGWKMLQMLAAKKARFAVFVASGYATEKDVKQCAGSDLNYSFLRKPFSIEAFHQELLKHLAGRVVNVDMLFPSGDAKAHFNLGVCYENGFGVPQDFTKASNWFRLAAKENHACAQYKLGRCFESGKGVPKNCGEAFQWYLKAAKQRLDVAEFLVGDYFRTGEAIPEDLAEAVKWYERSAEQGFAAAQVNLAVCYRYGRGVSQNFLEAAKWYHKAAEHGVAEAQSCLGDLYRNGEGVRQDMVEAVKWCRNAAEQGHVAAQYNLAVHYTCGAGVTQNYATGAQWYRAAAENGFAEAQACLGFCYHTGHGVPAKKPWSDSDAVNWYRRAADAGNVLAIHNLAVCYSWGRGVDQNHSEAVRLFGMLAERGNKTALHNLGLAYLYGRGVTRDLTQAHKSFKLAAERGYELGSKEMISTEMLLFPRRFTESELVTARTHERFIPMMSPQQFPNVEYGFVFTEPVIDDGNVVFEFPASPQET